MFTYVGYLLLIYPIFGFKTRKKVQEDKREREKIKPMRGQGFSAFFFRIHFHPSFVYVITVKPSLFVLSL